MPIDKSDKVYTLNGKTHRYIYSHAEEIVVSHKIWKRHIWIKDEMMDSDAVERTRLMEFESTNDSAPVRSKEKLGKHLSDFIRKYGDES